MKKTWCERTKSEKILIASRLIVVLVAFCAAIMKFLNFGSDALIFAIPLCSAAYFIETICIWKTNKDMAAVSLFMTIITAAIGCIVFFL